MGHSLKRRALNYKKIQNIKNETGIFIFSKIKTMKLQEPECMVTIRVSRFKIGINVGTFFIPKVSKFYVGKGYLC